VSRFDRAAVRTDGDVREEAGWLGPPGRRVFGVRHLPPEPRAALVVCSPVGGEGDSNYRREVLLSRALARRDIAVQRTHWRGTGNSDGDPAQLTFDSMVDDGCRAVESLATSVDAPTILLGTRLSGFVAAEVMTRVGGRALSLWQPPIDGTAYFRELGRMLRVNKMAQAAGHALDAPRSLHDELETDGVTEVGGYQIHRAYHRSMLDRRLADVTLPDVTDVQVVQFGGGSLPGHLQERVDEWGAAGHRVTTSLLSERETWWFAPDDSAEDQRPVTVEALAATVDWCATAITERSAPR
jgi:hypothetical protein